MGKPATGRPFEIEAIHVYRIENGRVAEHWANRDDVGLARQIGLFE
jgi:predicted ester cyclase